MWILQWEMMKNYHSGVEISLGSILFVIHWTSDRLMFIVRIDRLVICWKWATNESDIHDLKKNQTIKITPTLTTPTTTSTTTTTTAIINKEKHSTITIEFQNWSKVLYLSCESMGQIKTNKWSSERLKGIDGFKILLWHSLLFREIKKEFLRSWKN